MYYENKRAGFGLDSTWKWISSSGRSFDCGFPKLSQLGKYGALSAQIDNCCALTFRATAYVSHKKEASVTVRTALSARFRISESGPLSIIPTCAVKHG
jgi:hypothetical protein